MIRVRIKERVSRNKGKGRHWAVPPYDAGFSVGFRACVTSIRVRARVRGRGSGPV